MEQCDECTGVARECSGIPRSRSHAIRTGVAVVRKSRRTIREFSTPSGTSAGRNAYCNIGSTSMQFPYVEYKSKGSTHDWSCAIGTTPLVVIYVPSWLIVGRISCRRMPSSAVLCSWFTRNPSASKIGPFCSCVLENLAVHRTVMTSPISTASEALSSVVLCALRTCLFSVCVFCCRFAVPIASFCTYGPDAANQHVSLVSRVHSDVCLVVRLGSADLVQPVVLGVCSSSPPHPAVSGHFPTVSRRLIPVSCWWRTCNFSHA